MAKKINCHQSYDYGKTAARQEALKKEIELRFDAMKQYYVDLMMNIDDDRVIEELFDSTTFFTNERSRFNLELVMNSIQGGVTDCEMK